MVGQKQAGQPIDGIQVLRAVAAIMVVVFHARYSVPGGAHAVPTFLSSGVDIFFVISGYVMTLTTPATSTSETACLFIRKRIARIVPLYWLALAWTARRGPIDLNLLKDFLFIPRWDAVYPGAINPIVQQGWTLNYEMLFYVAFAASILFGRWRIPVLIGFLAVLSMCYFLPVDGIYHQFYCNDIILEFGEGVVLQKLTSKHYPKWRRAYFASLMALGFTAIAFGFGHSPRFITQGVPATLIVWSSIGLCEGWLRSKAWRVLGDSSYAIYLFHWASMGALKPLVALAAGGYLYPLIAAISAFAVISGIAVHLVIEKRLIFFAKKILGLESQSGRQLNYYKSG